MRAESTATLFGSKVSEYHSSAITQTKIAQNLSNFLEQYPALLEKRWLDIGCGPAVLSRYLYDNKPQISAILLDMSFQSLDSIEITANRVCADMDELPFLPNSFSGITASSSLQWSRSIPQLLSSCTNLLKPCGTVAIAVFTQNSLQELRLSQTKFGIPNPVFFPSHSEWKQMLIDCGCSILSEKSEEHTETFSSGLEALRAISRIGAGFHEGPKFSPSTLRQFVSFFESQYCDSIKSRYFVSYFIASRD